MLAPISLRPTKKRIMKKILGRSIGMEASKLNLMAPINSLGYGVAGLNILKHLIQDIDVTLFPIGPVEVYSKEEAAMVSRVAKKPPMFDHTAPCLKIWHEYDLAERIGSSTFFSFPFFEITKFDKVRINHLNSCDGIIVASNWAADVVKSQIKNSIPVHTVPLGVDMGIFNDANFVSTNRCIFFNCGKWERRKGHDVLLEAFKIAFPSEDDVELWMMANNPFLSPKESREWEVYYQSDKRVELIERKGTHQEVADTMRKVTCGVFPSRAEGWNLELLEMMAMGKPVIATDYSAHTEFCTTDNSMLIEIESFEKAHDGKWFVGDVGEWASLDKNVMDQLVTHMREVYTRWKSGSVKNEEGIETAQKFSWKNTVSNLKGIIYDG